jgi:16S rRNA (guanine527-N7)-methyltransferase
MMQIGSDQWNNLIRQGAARLGIEVTAAQADRFGIHGRELVLWNRKTNLTAITDPLEIAVKHFIDSLAALPLIPDNASLLDIGSGGGFPGLPLKIMRPLQPITMVDGVHKKISFIKYMIRLLALEHVAALHIRAEDMVSDKAYAGYFDVITCRALADLKTIVQLSLPLLSPRGIIIAYKGPTERPETVESLSAGEVGLLHGNDTHTLQLSSRDYRLPITKESRRLIILRRT